MKRKEQKFGAGRTDSGSAPYSLAKHFCLRSFNSPSSNNPTPAPTPPPCGWVRDLSWVRDLRTYGLLRNDDSIFLKIGLCRRSRLRTLALIGTEKSTRNPT